MARIHDLIHQVAADSDELAREITREVDVLLDRRAFGLNFERHTPEEVELPGRPVRRGDKVHVLPPDDEGPAAGSRVMWVVESIDRAEGTAALTRPAGNEEVDTHEAALADVVVVAEFRDPIYPGLVQTGTLERGGDRPFHSVINGENFHALQALLFTHRGRLDAIYMDPPYNTGARDWKYNNDYVAEDDNYRHSKWLAFIERRLLLAKDLLNPEDSVLIVTIDEKEYLRLGLLLEQVFPGTTIQMISSVIKPGGTSRTKGFSRVEEFIFFVFIGSAEVARTTDNMLFEADAPEALKDSDLWEGMVRRGRGVVRAQRPKQFYPIFIDPEQSRIIAAGEPLPPTQPRELVSAPDGLTAVWPIKDDGSEGFWQLSPSGLSGARQRGTVRVGSFNNKTGQWRIQYMKAAKAQAVSDGAVVTLGKDGNGVVVVDYTRSSLDDTSTPRTVWNKTSHDASTGGAGLVSTLIPGRKFPFPKSLYAVEDALAFFVAKKPNAVVLDCFAGSGTTAHAVMRLNRRDGGRRVSISVTNNEVSAEEQSALRQAGLRPGDPDWEKWGIFEHITRPRVVAAVEGQTPEGEPIGGDYRFTDTFSICDGFEENVRFFNLTYEAPLRIAAHRDFARVAPLLWLRGGSSGRCITDMPSGWDVADRYGVIARLDCLKEFTAAIAEEPAAWLAFIITDEDRGFEVAARTLPAHIEPIRLYDAYLRNFESEVGRIGA